MVHSIRNNLISRKKLKQKRDLFKLKEKEREARKEAYMSKMAGILRRRRAREIERTRRLHAWMAGVSPLMGQPKQAEVNWKKEGF